VRKMNKLCAFVLISAALLAACPSDTETNGKTVTEITVTPPEQVVYKVDETFDSTGMVVTASYSDGTKGAVKNGYEISGFDSATPGEKTITVTYDGKTATFTVEVIGISRPVANPRGGQVPKGITVTLSATPADAEIWYTTNGNTPAKGGTNGSIPYTTPIVINNGVTIRAIAVKDGMDDSKLFAAAYTLAPVGRFDTWNDWLASKYGKTFGWDAANVTVDPKTPITHNILAEEFFFAKGLNAGWNLGNTHDGGSNPRATNGGHYDKLFSGIKAAGFNVIRMPVTWGSGATVNGSGWNSVTITPENAADTVVSASLLDDVEAAIKAAHAAGLVVFINSHHDKSFFSLDRAGASLRMEGDEGADFVSYTERYKAVWRQIAERFKDYGDWLIFEALNEPTISSGGETLWDGAIPVYHEVLNRWCQAFVDTVRASGHDEDGNVINNNAKRYLIFKSYAGKLLQSTDPTNGFRVPTDPVGPGRLVYSFHSYVPQGLGLEGTSINWGSSHADLYKTAFELASDTYIKKGIPVFMGETGATFHSQRSATDDEDNNSILANRNRLLLLNALGYYARQYSVIPCLWDNGEATRSPLDSQGRPNTQPNGESFAMFRRRPVHDNNTDNWGKPIDHTKLAGGSNPASTGGAAMKAGNAASDDPLFGEYTIKAFIDAVNGLAAFEHPELSPKLAQLYADYTP